MHAVCILPSMYLTETSESQIAWDTIFYWTLEIKSLLCLGFNAVSPRNWQELTCCHPLFILSPTTKHLNAVNE